MKILRACFSHNFSFWLPSQWGRQKGCWHCGYNVEQLSVPVRKHAA